MPFNDVVKLLVDSLYVGIEAKDMELPSHQLGAEKPDFKLRVFSRTITRFAPTGEWTELSFKPLFDSVVHRNACGPMHKLMVESLAIAVG